PCSPLFPYTTLFRSPLADGEVQEYLDAFLKDDVNLEKSYFVTFEDGIFTTLAGNPPEDFYQPFETYKQQREANHQQLEIIILVKDRKSTRLNSSHVS